ncbi:MAG: hypothetical protein US52_C0014G0004 [candidate division WS6 bacterium GW2011_GWA2_37_6]|uniref:Uncharacterized protein n=1 Tax=candidate division WS6 bacterium GW2011_GWA2_37_6 TaxID=1619087 RepID=A0A0G0JGF7_9BACT|nr:MAG: hypothetical protein US52_C0014G0004 [candidate division WS6 bacterium GW2011_GWA2_37_6]
MKIKKAYVLLTTVIIIAIVTTLLVANMIAINTESTVSVGVLRDSKEALFLSDACAEVAIDKLKDNNTYTGNEVLNISSESCSILLVQGTGNTNRTVQTTSTVGDSTQKVQIVITQLNPDTQIASWKVVADH